MPMPRRFAWIVLIPLLLTGCVLHGPGDVRRDMAAATGAEYDREFAITLGRIGTSFARWGMRVAGEDDVPLQGVRKVEVGVYRVVEPPADGDGTLRLAPRWSPVVQLRQDGENVHVLLREDGDRVRAMLVVVQDAEELVIVRLKGRIDHIVEDAIRYGLDEAGSPHLADTTVAEYRSRS